MRGSNSHAVSANRGHHVGKTSCGRRRAVGSERAARHRAWWGSGATAARERDRAHRGWRRRVRCVAQSAIVSAARRAAGRTVGGRGPGAGAEKAAASRGTTRHTLANIRLVEPSLARPLLACVLHALGGARRLGIDVGPPPLGASPPRTSPSRARLCCVPSSHNARQHSAHPRPPPPRLPPCSRASTLKPRPLRSRASALARPPAASSPRTPCLLPPSPPLL